MVCCIKKFPNRDFRQACLVVQWYKNELSLRYTWLEMFMLKNTPMLKRLTLDENIIRNLIDSKSYIE